MHFLILKKIKGEKIFEKKNNFSVKTFYLLEETKETQRSLTTGFCVEACK